MADHVQRRINTESEFRAEMRAMQEKRLGNQEAPQGRELLHREALVAEYAESEARGLLRCARNLLTFDATPLGASERSPGLTLPELLVHAEHVVVVGAQGAGNSMLVAHLALHAERHSAQDPAAGFLPFVIPVDLLDPHERLDEATVARMSPAAGRPLIERVLAERRALVLVDGLDRAPGGASALLASIRAFAGAHPGNRVVVTTRPLPYGVLGEERPDLPEFTRVILRDPLLSSRVYPAHRFLGQRSPERKATVYLEHVETHLGAWEPGILPPESVLGRLTRSDQRTLFGAIALEHRSA